MTAAMLYWQCFFLLFRAYFSSFLSNLHVLQSFTIMYYSLFLNKTNCSHVYTSMLWYNMKTNCAFVIANWKAICHRFAFPSFQIEWHSLNCCLLCWFRDTVKPHNSTLGNNEKWEKVDLWLVLDKKLRIIECMILD